ncbi:hypothetical protein AAGT10_00710 [Sulfolobus tengchongensis]|uniref:Uncharacterized protein n=1 Tax=Sulfolobus tengchongensis TaxID=207809 RepID=A0AAX4L1L9_9CREN
MSCIKAKQIEVDLKRWEELVKLIQIYFNLDEITNFAVFELEDTKAVEELSKVKGQVRQIIEKMIS